ncbi:unnamed protein product, partial [Staurois parvus]
TGSRLEIPRHAWQSPRNTDEGEHRYAALYCVAEQYKTACLPSKTQHTVKHTEHTGNPLIAPYVNLFLPSVISTVSVLFISNDHCISVTGDISGS